MSLISSYICLNIIRYLDFPTQVGEADEQIEEAKKKNDSWIIKSDVVVDSINAVKIWFVVPVPPIITVVVLMSKTFPGNEN